MVKKRVSERPNINHIEKEWEKILKGLKLQFIVRLSLFIGNSAFHTEIGNLVFFTVKYKCNYNFFLNIYLKIKYKLRSFFSFIKYKYKY